MRCHGYDGLGWGNGSVGSGRSSFSIATRIRTHLTHFFARALDRGLISDALSFLGDRAWDMSMSSSRGNRFLFAGLGSGALTRSEP